MLAMVVNCEFQYKEKGNLAFVSYLLRIRSVAQVSNTTSPSSSPIVPTNPTISTNVVFSNTAGFITNESGSTASFTVHLNSMPTSNVTLNIASSNPSEGIVNPTTITFNSSNWNNPQTVSITGQNDALYDGPKIYTIQFTISSTDTNFNSLILPGLSVTNMDNDKLTFVTQTTTKGDTSGIAGADSICNSDVNKPSASPNIYKAFIADGINRKSATNPDSTGVAVGAQIDWVLYANTTYFRADGVTPLFNINASQLFDLNTAVQNPIDPSITYYWTGISNNWTSVQNCSDWTNQTGGFGGDAGDGTVAGLSSIRSTTGLCNSNVRLFCIQQ